MSKLSPSRVFAMQGARVPEPPQGLPLGGSRLADSFGPSDAAAVCAGLHPKFFYAGRVYWMQDWSSCVPLEAYLWVELAGLAAKERWAICIGQETLRGLAGLAIAELADPTKYGAEPARVAWFGKRLDLEGEKIWNSWEKIWRPRYQAIYDVLLRWTDVAGSHAYFKQIEEDIS